MSAKQFFATLIIASAFFFAATPIQAIEASQDLKTSTKSEVEVNCTGSYGSDCKVTTKVEAQAEGSQKLYTKDGRTYKHVTAKTGVDMIAPIVTMAGLTSAGAFALRRKLS